MNNNELEKKEVKGSDIFLNKNIKKGKKRELKKVNYLLEDYYSVNICVPIPMLLSLQTHGDLLGDSHHQFFFFFMRRRERIEVQINLSRT